MRQSLHTLVLLDIKVKEISEENLARGKRIYEPPRFMTIGQALEQLLEAGGAQSDADGTVRFEGSTQCVGLARVGQPSQKIVYGRADELVNVDFGEPLHSLIVVGETHPIELEILDLYKYSS